MENVKSTIIEIKKALSNQSASKKDEVLVMQAMLNDKDYVVGVYSSDGQIDEYCPSRDARNMSASIISSTTKISKEEAAKLADEHVFTKSEATSMIGISKEFVNTYLTTGRKLLLGARETSNVSLSIKEVPEGTKSYPKCVGKDADGKEIYDHPTVPVPAHTSVRVHGGCPIYLKK